MCNLTMSQQIDKGVIVSNISQRDVKEENALFLLYIIKKKSLNIQEKLSSRSETSSRGCLLTWTAMKHPQQMVHNKCQELMFPPRL